MLNATLFTAKKCGGVEYSGIFDNFFDMKNMVNELFLIEFYWASKVSFLNLK